MYGRVCFLSFPLHAAGMFFRICQKIRLHRTESRLRYAVSLYRTVHTAKTQFSYQDEL